MNKYESELSQAKTSMWSAGLVFLRRVRQVEEMEHLLKIRPRITNSNHKQGKKS